MGDQYIDHLYGRIADMKKANKQDDIRPEDKLRNEVLIWHWLDKIQTCRNGNLLKN